MRGVQEKGWRDLELDKSWNEANEEKEKESKAAGKVKMPVCMFTKCPWSSPV